MRANKIQLTAIYTRLARDAEARFALAVPGSGGDECVSANEAVTATVSEATSCDRNAHPGCSVCRSYDDSTIRNIGKH